MHIFYAISDAEIVKRELSRELLARALRQWISETGSDYDASELMESLSFGVYGKPYFALEGAPHFSISHSRNVWAVLIDDKPCGIDIQFGVPASYDRIARKYYSEEEAARVADAQGPEKEAEFYRIWTKREALLKASGATVFSDSQALGEPGMWKVREVLLAGGLFAAVAVGSEGDIIIEELVEA